ncbi:MAG: ATP-dependent DNA helicase UvrD2 [Acidimicrobiales bacterium]
MSGQHLLDGLNERQRQAVTTTGGPLVVLAGAGSGKTRVLTRRIAYRVLEGDTDPRRVLALTFTRKAAGEMRTRLRHLGLRDDVVAGTFHGVALTQLRERWAERGIQPPTILDRKYRMVSQLLGRGRGVEPMDVVAEIEWARARMVEPADYATAARLAGRTPPLPADDMADLLHRFAQEKRQRRVVDFDDLLALALRDLLADPDYANAVRWRHRHLYVDEFQDVNPLQFELLKAWRGRSDDLFVVGDPNQAIYGWNGADPDLLGRFAKRERTAVVIPLADNYRSTPQILTVASAALAGKAGQLIPHRHDGVVPTITAYPSEEDEAVGIAEALRAARSVGEPWSHQAVLVRTNAQLVPIEQALVASGIPVRVRGGSGPLNSPEVKSKLRELTRPGVDLRRAVADLVDTSEGAEPSTLTPAEIERRQNVDALGNLIRDYLAVDPMPNGPGLAAWIATIQAGEVATDTDAVDLATFHAAKGLEWPVVHLAGIEAGFVPISYAETGGQLAEEQRLLYVAVTRAERELHLSWAASRTFGTRARRRTPSPYLERISGAIEHLTSGQRPLDWRAKVEDSRTTLEVAAATTVDVRAPRLPNDKLFDMLQAWRRDRARAADVPPHVVCNDQTLRAVAATRPTSRSGLSTIKGLSAAKLERYGDELIEVVRSANDA